MDKVYEWDVVTDNMWVAGGQEQTMEKAAQTAFSYAMQYVGETGKQMDVTVKTKLYRATPSRGEPR